MNHETKTLTVEKMNASGQGLARLATLSGVDHDGDTYAKGAFTWKKGGEQWAPILPAHNRTAMPLGKARVYEDGDTVYAELHLNLATQAGRDWHETLKFDLEKGGAVQEWSYGFAVLDHAKEQRDGQTVRVLKQVDVHEVSPVIRGAGIGTATLSLKTQAGDGAAPCGTCGGSGKSADDADCPTCKGTGHAHEGEMSEDEAGEVSGPLLAAMELLSELQAALEQLGAYRNG
jgi:HK97 family phage prohead protease